MDLKAFDSIHRKLLRWYDQYQRILPWRAQSGKRPNPYHVWLSEVMLQQTTVATVKDYFIRFTQRWPTLQDLSQSSLDDIYHQWQGLGYYSRAKNLHACALALSRLNEIPKHPDELIKLPGIGAYTSASIASIAYDFPIIPVDGNITRVISRLLALSTPLPKLKDLVFDIVSPYQPSRSGDFAQGLMDLGATICTPKTPKCDSCPIAKDCLAYAQNKQNQIPVKTIKSKKLTRYTYAYWDENLSNELALIKRPDQGLLANLMSLPTSEWVDHEQELPSLTAGQVLLDGYVKHVFTHFTLILRCVKQISHSTYTGTRYSKDSINNLALPTLIRKTLTYYKIIELNR